MNASGRISLYIKNLSEGEVSFYFESKECQSKLIKKALNFYYLNQTEASTSEPSLTSPEVNATKLKENEARAVKIQIQLL